MWPPPLLSCLLGFQGQPLVARSASLIEAVAGGGCAADCNGHGVCLGGVCHCEPSWRGEDCGTSVCPSLCHGRGRCEYGVCICSDGFTGAACEAGASPSCPEHCSGHGWCIPSVHVDTNGTAIPGAAARRSQCSCRPGWRGAACDVDTCPRHCSRHGRCDVGVCKCSAGWHGPACDTWAPFVAGDVSVPAPARSASSMHATSLLAGTAPTPADTAGGGVSEAAAASLAHAAELRPDWKPTCPHDFNCSGRGDCLFGACHCRSGFAGQNCEIVNASCPGNCNSRGRCDHATGICHCALGYGAEDCGRSACAEPGDFTVGGCHGHGQCECDPAHGTCACVCQSNFLPPTCELSTCPDQCTSPTHGHCVLGTCVCEQRWHGRSCATELCPHGCSAPYGACVAGRCVCEPGWTGAGCENSSCPSPLGRVCAGHGACVAGHCVCAEGWTAPDCSLRKDSNESHLLCSETICGGPKHGICVNGDYGPCACKPGWTGLNCTDSLCPGSCSGHGFCTDAGCVCYEHYAGDECEIDVCPKNCSGRGICEAGRCQCEVGRRGVDCSLASNAQRALTADIDAPPVEQPLGGGEGGGSGEGGGRTLGGSGGGRQHGLVGGAVMLAQRGSAIRRLSSREPPALS